MLTCVVIKFQALLFRQHEVFVDSDGRAFAVKVSPPGTGDDLVKSLNAAFKELAENVKDSTIGEGIGRERWGIKNIAFGKACGGGNQVMLKFIECALLLSCPYLLKLITSMKPHCNSADFDNFLKNSNVKGFIKHLNSELQQTASEPTANLG